MLCRTSLLTVLIGVLAGCTSTSPGGAEPAPTGSSQPETTASASPPSSDRPSGENLPSDGAPKVKKPLETVRFQQKPCLALTTAQAQELNVSPQGEQREGSLGLGCNWRNSETGGDVDLLWSDKDPRGLTGSYTANKAGKYKYFTVLPEIEGFPAVARSPLDLRDKGECVIEVGVTDKIAFQLAGQLSRANVGKKDPCEVTVMVAGMMLLTMKAGG